MSHQSNKFKCIFLGSLSLMKQGRALECMTLVEAIFTHMQSSPPRRKVECRESPAPILGLDAGQGSECPLFKEMNDIQLWQIMSTMAFSWSLNHYF